ncbi:hypothetical protein N9K52_02290 [Litoricolaceae bacterium]|nr:hypothetical protein [Litorivicinaceae bacterium]
MAFNKGLQLNDGNTVVRDTIYLGSADKAFFQTKWASVDGVNQRKSDGSVVFTMRPDKSEGDSDALIELVKGQNLVLGMEYNAAGDQYRLLIQSKTDYGTTPLVTNVARGEFVAAEVETTFGITYSDSGVISVNQSGIGTQVLSIPTYTADQAKLVIHEKATPTAADVADLIIDDGRGNILHLISGNPTTNAGDLVDAVITAFTALTDEQKSGFVLQDGAAAGVGGALTELHISRTDGAGFVVTAGDDEAPGALFNSAAAAGGSDLTSAVAAAFDKRGLETTFFDLDFDGFVSQFAEFETPLSLSNLAGYVNQPETIPDPAVKSDAVAAKAVLTLEAVPNAVGDKYDFEVEDSAGNKLEIDFAATATTKADVLNGVQGVFDGLADSKGFSFDTTSLTDSLIITRADGADFKVVSAATSDYNAAAEWEVNGSAIANAGANATYSSTSSQDASIIVTEANSPAFVDGVTYEIVVTASNGDTHTYSAFVNAGTSANAAATALDAVADANGFVGAAAGANFTITRSDNRDFTVKLGPNDESANLKVGSTALAKDSTVSSHNGVMGGSPATLSNGVLQKLDFTTLNDATTVVGNAEANYTGEVTLKIFGLDKGAGLGNALQLGSTNNAYAGVDSTGYSGAVASSGDKISSDIIYGEVRDVTVGTGYTVDFYIDPNLVAGYKAINFTVAHTAALDVATLTVPEPVNGYKLTSVNNTGNSFDVSWFQRGQVTDFTSPIATVVFNDTATTNAPEFTFTGVDIDGVDYTDNSTYTQSFKDVLDSERYDVSGKLVNGNDSTTAVADQLVILSGYPDASAASSKPSSGLHLDLSSWGTDSSADSTDMDVTIEVKTETQTNLVSFEIDLPSSATVGDFVLDAALADWTVTTEVTEGRTLKIAASGATNATVGSKIGSFTADVAGGYGKAQHFDLLNVQTDADAATEAGRGLYVGMTRTKTDGTWKVDDMPAGTVTRDYSGTAEISNAVSSFDAYYALQVSAGLTPQWYNGSAAKEGHILAADFDGSGKVTAADALAILEHVVAAETPVPDPVVWSFFDVDTTGVTTTAATVKALSEHEAVAADTSLVSLADEVVIIGDLSNPA